MKKVLEMKLTTNDNILADTEVIAFLEELIERDCVIIYLYLTERTPLPNHKNALKNML